MSILLLMIVVCTAFVVFLIIKDHLEYSIASYVTDRTLATTYRACLLWMASFTAFVLMAVWLILVSLYPIASYSSRRDQRNVLAGTFVIISGISAWHLMSRFSGGQSLLDPLEPALRRAVVIVSTLGYAAGSLSVCLMIFACVALASTTGPLSVGDLRRRFDLAKLMLLSSAALLAASVAHVYFLYDWPWRVQHLTMPYASSAHEMARATAVAYAIVYTAFLIAAHLPLSVIQEFQMRAVMAPFEDKTGQLDLRQWKIQNGLDRSPLTMVVEVLAMAGPILTAIGLPKLLLGA